MSSDFKVYDCLLYMEHMQYPHLGENILTFLKKKVSEFGLNRKVTCVITDNESNIVRAINLQDDVEHLPCAAHTLQLSINRAFQKSSIYIKRIKRLVCFFTTSPKQSEHLNNTQKECQRQTQTSLLEIFDNSDDNYSEDDNITNILSNISDNLKEQIYEILLM